MENVIVILNLLSKEECKHLIEKIDKSPLLQAERNGADYKRSVFWDADIASELQKRMFHLVPKNINAVNLSDRLRFSKYDIGGNFHLHQDGIYQDPRTGHRSAYTLSIFLNDDYEGGETNFYNGDSLSTARLALSVKPEAGKAVLFPRQVYHCGNTVQKGNKYLLRTDVMVSI